MRAFLFVCAVFFATATPSFAQVAVSLGYVGVNGGGRPYVAPYAPAYGGSPYGYGYGRPYGVPALAPLAPYVPVAPAPYYGSGSGQSAIAIGLQFISQPQPRYQYGAYRPYGYYR